MIKSFGLLILRLSIGTMLIHHGYEKLADIENFADAFVRPIGLPFPIFSSYIAASVSYTHLTLPTSDLV